MIKDIIYDTIFYFFKYALKIILLYEQKIS